MAPVELIDEQGFETLMKVKRGTIWRWRREQPDFPKPIALGRRLLWRQSEVMRWIASRPHRADLPKKIA